MALALPAGCELRGTAAVIRSDAPDHQLLAAAVAYTKRGKRGSTLPDSLSSAGPATLPPSLLLGCGRSCASVAACTW